jgi:flavocytochrome c
VKFKKEVLHMQGHSVARTLSTKSGSGREIVSPLLARAVELGAQISLGVEVKSLIHAEGRIMGLTATVQDEKAISKTSEMMLRRCEMTSFSPTGNDEESAFRIQCGGIILASGGYAADTALIAAQRPNWKLSSTIPSTGKESATALKAALRCGAMPIQLDNLQLLPSCSPDEEGFGRIPYFAMGAGLPYGILVDPETGRRFVNERTSKRELSKHLMLLGHPAICIVDARGLLHSLDFNKSRPPALRAFSTLKELAASVGISQVSALQEEVDAFNKNLTNKEGVHPPEDALPISTPPFFACRLWPKVHHCLGGLQINEFSQVVDVEGSPISGLYAAGEVVGGIHGADRLGSCSITDALTFGRLAGHNLASGGVCLASSFNHQHSH